jgi:hypothetical protein
MRKIVIFYSWQSDRPARINKNFIERALSEAVKRINAEPAIGVELTIDKDTKGVSGTPPITETILKKITNCDVFVPDVTYVATYDEGDKGGKPCPNPNVMAEYGYALLAKKHEFMMPIMNVAFGDPTDLPFDMGHLRHPIQYDVSANTEDEGRRKERKQLSDEIEHALRVTIAALPPPPPSPPLIAPEVIMQVRHWRNERAKQLIMDAPVALWSGPRLAMHVVPATAFGTVQRADFSHLRDHYSELVPSGFMRRHFNFDTDGRVSFDHWIVFDPQGVRTRRNLSGWTAQRSDGTKLPLGEERGSSWYVMISDNGIFEIVMNLDPVGELHDAGAIGLDGFEIEREIIETLDKITSPYRVIGMTAPALAMITLLEVNGCLLIKSTAGRSEGFDRMIVPLPEVIVPNFAPPLGNVIRPALDDLWRAAGWGEGSPSYGLGEWVGYKKQ